MSDSLTTRGQIVEIRPLGQLLHAHQQTLLVKTQGLEIYQLTIPAGGKVPNHEAHGEIILHCL
jgi:quercetin dioxygenase-like cupin family protein